MADFIYLFHGLICTVACDARIQYRRACPCLCAKILQVNDPSIRLYHLDLEVEQFWIRLIREPSPLIWNENEWFWVLLFRRGKRCENRGVPAIGELHMAHSAHGAEQIEHVVLRDGHRAWTNDVIYKFDCGVWTII